MPLPRQKAAPSRRPLWIVVPVALICATLIGASFYQPRRYSSACRYLTSGACGPLRDWLPPVPARPLTDDELASRVVIRDMLAVPAAPTTSPKVAFMFLTPGSLPFEKLWEKFFQGQEGKYSIYVHASGEKLTHRSPLFIGREIRSEKVAWGKLSMIDAEKRLLARALQDTDNQHFVLLSDSCVPLHSFDYIYHYLLDTNVSFVDCFEDPGPHGSGRYSKQMLPEVRVEDWRKGSQWFSIKRQHALLILADSLYYTKFKMYCKPGMEHGRNCYADEHYMQTLLHMVDPAGIANWSVTHVDWSERKWHPKAYRARDVTSGLLKSISSINVSYHETSDEKRLMMQQDCVWNGIKRPCYLFARKFNPDALRKLMHLSSNFTRI